MNTPKPWYTSKTVWFNVIMTIILVAEIIPQILPFIPEEARYISVGVFAVGNIILRVWFTDTPIQTHRV